MHRVRTKLPSTTYLPHPSVTDRAGPTGTEAQRSPLNYTPRTPGKRCLRTTENSAMDGLYASVLCGPPKATALDYTKRLESASEACEEVRRDAFPATSALALRRWHCPTPPYR